MKTSTRILGLLSTAVIGLTLTSCGGGGGGGGNGGGGNNNAGSGGSSANTGLAPKSLASQMWVYDWDDNNLYTFTFLSNNEVKIRTRFRFNGVLYDNEKISTATYTYEPNGDKAVIKITGTIYHVRKVTYTGNGTAPGSIESIQWGTNNSMTLNLIFHSKFDACNLKNPEHTFKRL